MTVLDRMIIDPCRSIGHMGSWVGSISKRKSGRQLHPFCAAEQQRRMKEAEIDRWSTTTQFRWRKCFSCSCYSIAHLVACDVCGAPTVPFEEAPAATVIGCQRMLAREHSNFDAKPLHKVSEHDATRNRDMLLEKAEIVVDADCAERSRIEHSKDSKAEEGETALAHCEDQSNARHPEDSTVEECESIDFPESLDESPPIGTLVEVMFEGEEWAVARILEAKGSKAQVMYDSGERDIIDFEFNFARLLNKDSSFFKTKGCVLNGISPRSNVPQVQKMTPIPELCEDDDDSQYVCIDGTLDHPPESGTSIKVLHENDVWRCASIIESCGSIASVRYHDNDQQDEIDFMCDAVRPHDYISDDESDFDGGEDTHAGSKDPESANIDVEVSDEECNIEYEYVDISGLLDEPPLAGTEVKVLLEDKKWSLARVLETDGLKAKVVYESGEIDELDFECDPVRPIDYMSDDEEH